MSVNSCGGHTIVRTWYRHFSYLPHGQVERHRAASELALCIDHIVLEHLVHGLSQRSVITVDIFFEKRSNVLEELTAFHCSSLSLHRYVRFGAVERLATQERIT